MDEKKKKFRIDSLGCRTNQYEAQAFHDQLAALGYEPASENEQADLCLVNTCTVTESADSSSRRMIRQLAKKNPNARIAVTGCYAERNPDAVRRISGVTHVVPNAHKEELLSHVFPDLEKLPEFSIKRFDAHTRAFVKVQDGCNSFCTYCIIPYVRGRSRSRTLEDIVQEVEKLVANGYKEIVLTGINIGDFDGAVEKGNAPVALSQLVRSVDAVPGVERIRISSIDPDEVDDELIEAVIQGKHTCHSMHVVLQAGSNVVLKRMNRKYTRQIFMDTVDRLKNASPRFTFTTDIIVGFPGETEADFQETLDVMKEVCFAKVHMFPYSDRPRTRSALYPNKVPNRTIQERKQRLLRLAERHAYELREQAVGKIWEVLTESRESRGISGHTDHFLEVCIDDNSLSPNQIARVYCEKNTPSGLVGSLV